MNAKVKILVVSVVVAAATAVLPLSAAAQPVNSTARAYCNAERTDRQDFIRQYGSAGQAGMRNCIRIETRLAKRECRAELKNDRVDYIRQFGGTGPKAFKRCQVYELRN